MNSLLSTIDIAEKFSSRLVVFILNHKYHLEYLQSTLNKYQFAVSVYDEVEMLKGKETTDQDYPFQKRMQVMEGEGLSLINEINNSKESAVSITK